MIGGSVAKIYNEMLECLVGYSLGLATLGKAITITIFISALAHKLHNMQIPQCRLKWTYMHVNISTKLRGLVAML